MSNVFRNDEPVDEDSLGRKTYADALANMAVSCDTPMVIGLFGSWGVGKTSLMRIIAKKVNYHRPCRWLFSDGNS